ncbi:crotonase/enoyl-CoA hydratase family protein [Mameliella sp. CS4]|uniref:crotonase/enoyl-CoA hydratase family protein n=1 Tax=Mameliella sp. CS4 TaxID=2862329 RepID=UPI001C5EA574|nr:crotonase/enoyl-CoA hydratase family protein [Mameliella sp. CS4]MBW4984079.1 crotonase/enoyl-CoA hydratase family protein [Mameliella sp. CS4]
MDLIGVSRDARGVAEISLRRADKHNALSAQMMTELEATARSLAEEAEVKVVVLSAEGKSFCAGGDLAWMRAQFEMDRATRREESARIAKALAALYALPQPLIGKVQGNAFGGGLGLISVCDIALAAEGANFGLTEVKLGLIPANIGPYVIARLGAVKAQEIFMNGRIFGAGEAVALGLVNRAVPAEALDEAVAQEVALPLACAPGAVRDAKALLRRLAGEVTEAEVEGAIDALADRWETSEAQEGIAAFFDKRPAPWA